MSNLAVQTNNLCKTFDGKEVVRNCSMHVERGTIQHGRDSQALSQGYGGVFYVNGERRRT